MISTSSCHCGSRCPKGPAITRSSNASAATLGAEPSSAVTELGEPS